MDRSRIPLNALKAFEAAARHGSFQKAAEELFVTPAAVGQQIKALERLLGRTLFHRRHRRVELTAEAEELAAEVTRAFDLLGGALVRAQKAGRANVVTISASPAFAYKWLVSRLSDFHRRHPDIEVRLDASERLVNLATEPVDVAIRYGAGGYQGVESVLLFKETLVPVCSKAYLERHPAVTSMDGLLNAALIEDDTSHYYQDFPNWKNYFAKRGISLPDQHTLCRARSSLLATEAALEGQGVILGRSVVIRDYVSKGLLVRVGDEHEEPGLGYYLLSELLAGEQNRNPAARAFISWLTDAAAPAANSVGYSG